MRREASRVAFLMHPFCVRALSSNLATNFAQTIDVVTRTASRRFFDNPAPAAAASTVPARRSSNAGRARQGAASNIVDEPVGSSDGVGVLHSVSSLKESLFVWLDRDHVVPLMPAVGRRSNQAGADLFVQSTDRRIGNYGRSPPISLVPLPAREPAEADESYQGDDESDPEAPDEDQEDADDDDNPAERDSAVAAFRSCHFFLLCDSR
jgi:hypothetical protein